MTLPRLQWPVGRTLEQALGDEWVASNGLGGYAGTSVAFCATRKYHGLLTAALPGLGRMNVLPLLEEHVTLAGRDVRLGALDAADTGPAAHGFTSLVRFELEGLIPEWEYALGGHRLHRAVLLVHGENTVCVRYRLQGEGPVTLTLRPFLDGRNADGPLRKEPLELRCAGEKAVAVTLPGGLPPVTLQGPGTFTTDATTSPLLRYRIEQARGYDAIEQLSSPGRLTCTLTPGEDVFFVASLAGARGDPRELWEAEQQRERELIERSGVPPESVSGRLVLAADQFVIVPGYRAVSAEVTRSEHQRSIVAGYPWFTDWGRDTMISLEGLALRTGRVAEAIETLRTFREALRDGLVPNYFPEGTNDSVYHTADATLWFFHALSRVIDATRDLELLREFWPSLQDIVQHHLVGTRFHIGVDPADGLLRQGEEGYQLTWMDAKVDGWVVTPRRGKAVELQALWFNALCLMRDWAGQLGADGSAYAVHAAQAQRSFNARFWNELRGCCFDVIDGPHGVEANVRPNQVFALSLTHPILAREKWGAVLEVIRRELLTPAGLRTLSMDHPDFKAAYDGDLRSRDAAYHQGTVWPWLLGHYVDAERRAGADEETLRRVAAGLTDHLRDGCVGSLSEIFDATPPFHHRGCYAQAWSVAELLRIWTTLEPASP